MMIHLSKHFLTPTRTTALKPISQRTCNPSLKSNHPFKPVERSSKRSVEYTSVHRCLWHRPRVLKQNYNTSAWTGGKVKKSRSKKAVYSNELPLHCVFKVISVVTPPNYFLPWQKKTSKDCIGSGFIAHTKYGRKLFTNAHVVDHATTVLIRRGGSTNSYIAKVVAIGYDCDLAELQVSDEFFLEDTTVEGEAPEELQGLELGYIPELHSRVKVIGYPTGGDNVSVTRGVVSRIEPQQYAYSIVHNLLAIQIDAAINPGNSGGPALDENNKIVGVAFQSLMGADNIGYIIPTPIIEHFIEDVQRNGQYLGFSRLGVYTQILDQAYAAREYLKLKKDMTGILVSFVEPISDAHDKIKKGDVILQIEGTNISNDGTVHFRNRERISFDYLMLKKYIGDSCHVRLWRDEKPRTDDIVPAIGKPPSYMIYGGLVFTRLTLPYLIEYGDDWYNAAPKQFVHKSIYEYQRKPKQEIVILSHVLVDECNICYSSFLNMQLNKVNGEEVVNLKHLNEILTKVQTEFVLFELEESISIILKLSDVKESEQRIMENHGVPRLKSKDLEESTLEIGNVQ